MQSLSLLRLIEKFAEIHRQVSLRSLTTVDLGIPTCLFSLNPFQLQNASHSALKLHLFLNKVTLGCCPNPLGALPQTPARNFVPCTLSPLRGIELWFQKKPERLNPSGFLHPFMVIIRFSLKQRSSLLRHGIEQHADNHQHCRNAHPAESHSIHRQFFTPFRNYAQ